MILLLKLWICYAIVGGLVYSAVLIWAVRNKQFTELDRQRRIALDVEELPEVQECYKAPHAADRFTWIVMLIMTLLMVAAVLILGLKSE